MALSRSVVVVSAIIMVALCVVAVQAQPPKGKGGYLENAVEGAKPETMFTKAAKMSPENAQKSIEEIENFKAALVEQQARDADSFKKAEQTCIDVFGPFQISAADAEKTVEAIQEKYDAQERFVKGIKLPNADAVASNIADLTSRINEAKGLLQVYQGLTKQGETMHNDFVGLITQTEKKIVKDVALVAQHEVVPSFVEVEEKTLRRRPAVVGSVPPADSSSAPPALSAMTSEQLKSKLDASAGKLATMVMTPIQSTNQNKYSAVSAELQERISVFEKQIATQKAELSHAEAQMAEAKKVAETIANGLRNAQEKAAKDRTEASKLGDVCRGYKNDYKRRQEHATKILGEIEIFIDTAKAYKGKLSEKYAKLLEAPEKRR